MSRRRSSGNQQVLRLLVIAGAMVAVFGVARAASNTVPNSNAGITTIPGPTATASPTPG